MSDRSNLYRDIFNGKNQERWEEEQKQKNSKLPKFQHQPDAYKHQVISFIKSGVRILGYALLPFNLVAATFVLIFSEVIGIIEELV